MDWFGNWYGQMGFILISVTQGRQRLISTLIAAVHYLYMREYWVSIKQTPIGYRYIEWSLTVPLQTTNFLYILRTMKPDLGAGLFGRLLLGTIVMLASTTSVNSTSTTHGLGCALGIASGGVVLSELFANEGEQVAKALS